LDAKEQVRQAVDIVDLVGSYVQLRRQGRAFVGVCPWHDDSRPSLQVNPDRQSWKCWVCDIGGDVFSFIMQSEGVGFREALEMLAERAAIPLQWNKPAGPKPEAGSPDDKQTLFRAVAWAETQFYRCLLDSPLAERARNYLSERGISRESIDRFRIGFAPQQWDWLLTQAGPAGFSPAVLEKTGLVIARDSSDGWYDRFRGRVMFSIRDAQTREPRPIAFGGRILPELSEQEPAKYINSPETPLFSKNRQVYGLELARDAIAREKTVVVMEGYTDCVMAHQHGVEHVVAVLGTALGERHVALLRRFADSITLVLDGDDAGQRRTNEILELFVAAQADLRILTLPENLDPCDFVRAHGGDALVELLGQAQDALEHKLRTVTKGLDITTDTHQANAALEDVLGTLARAPRLASGTSSATRLREQQILSRLSRKFGPAEEELRKRVTELRRTSRAPSTGSEPEHTPARRDLSLDAWDRTLLELLVTNPAWLPEARATILPPDLHTPTGRAIYNKCLQMHDAGATPDVDRLLLESEDSGMKKLLVELDEGGRNKDAALARSTLADIVESFRRKKEDERHRQIFTTETTGEATDRQEEALGELIANLRNRQSRTNPTEG
jgi:DNA primase